VIYFVLYVSCVIGFFSTVYVLLKTIIIWAIFKINRWAQ